MKTALNDAIADLRAALIAGEDRATATAAIAADYGLNPALLARYGASVTATPLGETAAARAIRIRAENAEIEAANRVFLEVLMDYARNKGTRL